MVEQTDAVATRDDDLVVQPIPVRFEATGGVDAGPLSWGQQELWQIMRHKDSWLPIGTIRPLPAGTTVEGALADLRFVMSRYPAMRTRLRLDGEAPVQVVGDRGEVPLEVVDVPDEADPEEAAERTWHRLADTAYDFETDWPLRVAVIRHRDRLTHRVWVMCHLATDGGGARVVVTDLADPQAAAGPSESPPLAQARWQASPAGQRHCEVVMRHWEQTLRRMPTRRYPECVAEPGPRFWQGRFTSPALHLAARVITDRTGVESGSVMLALFATVLARQTGINPVAMQLTVGNRFRPGLARTVSPIMQNGLCVIEVPDGTVDDAVRHARRRAFVTYKYSYYDPRRRDALIEQVSAERGEQIDLSCFFNDRRLKTRDDSGPLPTTEQLTAAVAQHQFEWRYQQDRHRFDKLYVSLDDVADTARMTVLCDTHAVPGAQAEQCLFAMEELAVAAALDQTTSTLAPPLLPVPAGAAA